MSDPLHPFIIPLTKIDVERRLIIGTAAEEATDKSKEIMDYATARPRFEAWSKAFSDSTGGLSKGNLRVMHTRTVAGRLDDISYDDVTKKVMIVAKVSDDNEWQKCLDGNYTGFSIGGGYANRWDDPEIPGVKRYTPDVREISLVDSPCMHGAKFVELVKADGLVETMELHGVPSTFTDKWASRPIEPETFGKRWAARPRTFGELHKGFTIPRTATAGLDAAVNRATPALSGALSRATKTGASAIRRRAMSILPTKTLKV